ncbi:MAG: hypothetical protein CMP23_13460 [Rickettsiales bacterium]|nr:hypothetical protein [Rickettsiales bacterium]|tara:strand:+ start:1231 stop:2034 length:804 start_codon:yes stop_codon:yes gene_type:complete
MERDGQSVATHESAQEVSSDAVGLLAEVESQGSELGHLERAASLGYLLGAISHEINNHLTNLLLGADAGPGEDSQQVVERMTAQAQRAGEVVARFQKLARENLSRGRDRVDLGELSSRVVWWLEQNAGQSMPAVLHPEQPVVVMAGRQNLLRALSNLARVAAGSRSEKVFFAVAVEQAPRSLWAPSGDAVDMASLRIRCGVPPAEESVRLKELVDDFFGCDRDQEDVALMAAWEVIRKLRGRLQLYGGGPGEGFEALVLLPLAPDLD